MGLTSSSLPSTPAGSRVKPSTALPTVGCGMYEVGCADIMVASNGSGDNGVFMRIFYPTALKIEPQPEPSESDSDNESDSESDATVTDDPIEYPLWNERREYINGLAEYRQMSQRKIHFYFDWIIGERRIPAGWQQPLFNKRHPNFVHASKSTEAKGPQFPVAVFSHGLSGSRLIYSTYCTSLASYGYVVAAVEHRDRSSSWTYRLKTDPATGIVTEEGISMLMVHDGEGEFKKRNQQNHTRVAECIRALHLLEELNMGQCGPADKKPKGSKIVVGQEFDWLQFKNRLDISKAAVIGHSMGGATAVAAAAFSTDFRCCIVLDGWLYPIEHELYAQTTMPALMLNVDGWQWAENIKRIQRMNSEAAEKPLFTFKNIVHQSFSDFTYLMPGFMGRKFGVQGDIDPHVAGEAYLELSVAFLRQALSGSTSVEALREVAQRYEFVVEGTTVDLEDEETATDDPKSDDHQTLQDSNGDAGSSIAASETESDSTGTTSNL
uniref:1-alkyl-2-acetylglycerophosphocholine esterase n=1 Tax=Panagrellus redivivus TaxID=6233 RepID=A0A7E4W5G9_PANRE